jgi:hypothetical protein
MTPRKSDHRHSLVAGTDAIVHRVLGIKNLRHRSSLDRLSANWPAVETMTSMVEQLFAQVSTNWDIGRGASPRQPSSQNWRWGRPVTTIAAQNRSPEVVLERAIARACGASGRTDWCNQIPVASGVIDSSTHKRSAIDLVHQEGVGAFDFVELKIHSDTPLLAAIEIVQYGLIWLLSRRDRVLCGYRECVLRDASTIRLCVLGPSSYYGDRDLSPLANALSAGLHTIGAAQGGVALSFAFQEFSDVLLRTHGYSDDEALAVIDTRQIRRHASTPNPGAG